MIECKQILGQPKLLWVTPAMQELEEALTKAGISQYFILRVNTVSVYHFLTKEEYDVAPRGLQGYMYPTPEAIERYDEKYLTLTIQLNYLTLIDKQRLEVMLDQLTLTPNGRGKPWCHRDINSTTKQIIETTTRYIYKKQGFDDAYQAIVKLIPFYTEDSFARLDLDREYSRYDYLDEEVPYCSYLVDETNAKREDEVPLATKVYKDRKDVPTGEYNINIEIQSVDISSNLSQLVEILNYCVESRKI